MGSIGSNQSSSATADYSQGYENVGEFLRTRYKTSQDLMNAGFRALNDWSLSSLLRLDNEIAADNQPWNNKVVYFIWDKDFKVWQKAAERRY